MLTRHTSVLFACKSVLCNLCWLLFVSRLILAMALLPVACAVHCHIARLHPPAIIETSANVPIFICHQAAKYEQIPPIDLDLIRTLQQSVVNLGSSPLPPLQLCPPLPMSSTLLWQQHCDAPPDPPPRSRAYA